MVIAQKYRQALCHNILLILLLVLSFHQRSVHSVHSFTHCTLQYPLSILCLVYSQCTVTCTEFVYPSILTVRERRVYSYLDVNYSRTLVTGRPLPYTFFASLLLGNCKSIYSRASFHFRSHPFFLSLPVSLLSSSLSHTHLLFRSCQSLCHQNT